MLRFQRFSKIQVVRSYCNLLKPTRAFFDLLIPIQSQSQSQSNHESRLSSTTTNTGYHHHHHQIQHPLISLSRCYSNTSSSSNHKFNQNQSSSSPTRWLSITLISLGTLSMGYVVGTSYPPNLTTQLIINSILRPAPQPSHLIDPLEAKEITQKIEAQLHQLEIVKRLKSDRDNWSSFRPFANSDPAKLTHNLTQSTLRGPGKFAITPLVFINKKKTEAVIILHVGEQLCGHDGIVHGGLLATVCDEGLAALAFNNLPNQIGVTATLKLSYLKPVLANQFIVLRSWLSVERPPQGRKVWSDGQIEDLSGQVLVKAESLFVEPKIAKFLSNSKVKEFMKADP